MWRNGQDINELDEPILLIEPKTHAQYSNNSRKKKSKNLKPNTSFVGGQPIFYPNDDRNITSSKISYSSCLESTMKDDDNMTFPLFQCDNCHDPMYLLIQMYAPLDDLERTLYVFGCNKASCFQVAFSSKRRNDNDGSSGTSGNYDSRGDNDSSKSRFCLGGMGVVKCLRSQQSQEVDLTNDCKDTNDLQPSTLQDETNKITKDVVENKKDDNDGWGDTGGGWGDETDDGGWGDFNDNDTDLEMKTNSKEKVSMDDLEAMLSAMEAKEIVEEEEDEIDNMDVQSSSSVRKGYEKTTTSTNKSNVQTSQSKEMQSNTSNNDEDEDEDKIPPYSFAIHELETYNEPSSNIEGMQKMEEDDDDMIGLSSNGRDDSKVQKMLSSYLKEEEDETVKAIIGGSSSGSSSKNRGSTTTTGGNQIGYDEKYERLPPDDRAFLSFIDRIKRAPYQVARYAYDGVPMWSM